MKHNNTTQYLSVLLIAVILFSFLTVYASSAARGRAKISARAATLYEPETGRFLYEKNKDLPLPMASTTKIMTALVTLENSSLYDVVKIDGSAVGVEGSSAYLRQGDERTVEELLYALLLQSANDAAVAIACHVGGSVGGFADMMNAKAEELGLRSTHFTNPHGLDDEEHYTTAGELAVITSHALKNGIFKEIVSTYKKSFSDGMSSRIYVNHNKLLNRYDGCIGVKTGFTKKSGRCLVGASEKDGLTFITVTLDAPDDWNDHRTLFDIGHDTLEKLSFAKKEQFVYTIPVINGTKDTVKISNGNALEKIVDKGEYEVKEYVKLAKFATAPIKQGDVFGEVIFTLDGEYIGSVKLTADATVDVPKKKGLFERIKDILRVGESAL